MRNSIRSIVLLFATLVFGTAAAQERKRNRLAERGGVRSGGDLAVGALGRARQSQVRARHQHRADQDVGVFLEHLKNRRNAAWMGNGGREMLLQS